MKLWNYIKNALRRNPQQEVSEGDVVYTYEDLVRLAEEYAKKLEGERCCAILCDSELLAALSLLACFAAGVTAVPLSKRYGKLHCDKILDAVSPTAIISDAAGALRTSKLSNALYKAPREHPALIMCTSGTTGKPKGAMLSEDNVLTNVSDICEYFDIKSEDHILIARPLYHCAVLTGEFLTSIIKGAKISFCSAAFNPKSLLDMISEHNITAFCGTPTLLGMMARFSRNGMGDSLKKICVSGECMSADTAKAISSAFPTADIYHVYGLTEACPRVSYLPPRLFKTHAESVGVPLRSVSLKIVKPDGKTACENEEGILWIRGGNVMLGYYNAPEQTASVLKDGWLCTRDVAVIDFDGLLRIKGRSDDLIIRAGMNIYPQEIESALKSDKRVRDVLVYGYNAPYTGVQIGMKISGDFSGVEEIKRLCVELLPSFQVPNLIELLDELPKNASGKIIRGAKHA